MTDYGHPLRFGAFITRTNGQPQVPVRLAQLTERLGDSAAGAGRDPAGRPNQGEQQL
jgi:hypothetical protein